MSYLSELLRVEQIQLQLKATDRPGVLRELVELVPAIQREKAQQESFLAALLEREKLHTTAIGDGIAFPHARNALSGLLKQPSLVFGRHTTGVPYGALDGKPVRLFFLFAAPNFTDHLAILAQLSRALRKATLRSGLLEEKRPEQIIELFKQLDK